MRQHTTLITIALFTMTVICHGEIVINESFDHAGSLPTGWTVESHSTRGVPWHAVQDAGDDWSLSAGHTQYGNTDDEWLITPVFDLTGCADVVLQFEHIYLHHMSSATLRYSDNGGVSWNPMASWNASTSGLVEFDISTWADELPTVRFLFVFAGEFLSNGAEWNLDDFQLLGTPTYDDQPPVSFNPIPPQPMEGYWSSLAGTIGCTFADQSGVDASSIQVRIDANGDGDYGDGGAEEWTDVTGHSDADSMSVTVVVNYLYGMPDMSFEFRVQDVSATNDLYGYSGYGNQEGIEDDWAVTIVYDNFAPVFSEPVPAGQPEPPWIGSRTVDVGCTVWDSTGTVDATTLALRLDLNQDLDYYDVGEEWNPLDGYVNAEYIIIQEEIVFPTDGEFHVEFQASDTEGNGPGFSMNSEGINDDMKVRIDTTPPVAPYLMVGSTTENSVTLMFSPTDDLTFDRYEIFVSEDSLVDETDLLWSDTNDPLLGERTTYTTTVTNLAFGSPYWFRMRTVDGLNHIGAWSQIVYTTSVGVPIEAVGDLTIARVSGGVLIQWSPPTHDINGNEPIFVEGYDIHTSTDPYFLPTEETRIATSIQCSYTHLLEISGDVQGFYEVVVRGNGSTMPILEGFTLVPSGSFEMGSNDGSDIEQPVHQVTIANYFFIGTQEVTNQEYLTAIQWAYDNGYVTASDNQVLSHGESLLNLASGECQITFSEGVFSLLPVHYGSYAGQSSANHPVMNVSWYGAACYCDWLSMMEGLEPFYDGDWSTHGVNFKSCV